MKNYSRHFLICILIAVLLVVGYSFVQYKVLKNFVLTGIIECSSSLESCFVADCSSDDVACDATPYQKIQISARNAPSCLYEHTCENFVCTEATGCIQIICNTDSLEEGEKCVIPQDTL